MTLDLYIRDDKGRPIALAADNQQIAEAPAKACACCAGGK